MTRSIFLFFRSLLIVGILPAVFLVVAVNTEVFPVGAVRRVIQMIPIFMVDGKKVACLVIEFSAAFDAEEAMDFEGTFSVITAFTAWLQDLL